MRKLLALNIVVLLAALAAVAAPHWSTSRESGRDIIADSMAASVQLVSERANNVRRSASGVALTNDGAGRTLILTAGHLVLPLVSQVVHVNLPGDDMAVEARIVAVDEAADLALLEAIGLPARPVQLQPAARLGDRVWVVSFPWGRHGTVVGGAVSQIVSRRGAGFPIEGPVGLIDATVSYGTSGAGVFDARTGHLVGIVRGYRTAKLSLPGTPTQSLELPIAGETTVVPTTAILCLLAAAELEGTAALIATGARALPSPCDDV